MPTRPTLDVPPFQPDPELIEHMEDNRRWRRRFREHAMQTRVDAGLPPLVAD